MTTTTRPPLLVVAGATATGKTDLAIRLGEALIGDGRPVTIISADSRQVYRGLDIGTAKVTAADRRRVPHAGLDLVDPPERFTLSDFVRHVDGILAQAARDTGVVILAGGTGLYLRAVARGLPVGDLPDDPAIRARLEGDLARDGLAALVERLRAAAPTLATSVDLANPRRVLRALEIAEIRGDGPRPAARGYDGPVAWIGLEVGRAEHARRIAARAREQFAAGLVDEAIALRARYDPSLPCFSAIGYAEAWAVADGRRSLEEAVTDDTMRNIAFAKRQRTWFRSEPDITWVDATSSDPFDTAVAIARRLADSATQGRPGRSGGR
ncbi:MAG: tRNA (adenosine(37)-N6)-dimethylallyltransferase MiaA [Chloroflexota bacterium]